jgi:hypothetical protein
MPTAIRNLDTGLFFAHGQWTHDPKLAQDFPDEESARKVVRKFSIKNADLVTISDEGRVLAGRPIRLSN